MALLPTFDYEYTEREVTDTFAGYHHRAKIGDGELYDSGNLTTAEYPLLANRKKRGLVRTLTAAQGLLAKEQLAWVDGGTLYCGGSATGLTGLTAGHKQLVSMGAYICVFPDKKYYNTADSTDFGSMEAAYSTAGTVKYRMCRRDGTEYATPAVSDTAPLSPADADLWIDTSREEHVLKQYSSASGEWASIPTVYTKLSFISQGEVPGLFRQFDGVTISGAEAGLNGDKVLYAVGGDAQSFDFVVIAGLLEQAVDSTEGTVRLERRVPDTDFVIEAQNRLWGCRYGGGLNEIYCCALGDFKNWRQYMGLSTDSWTASVGSDGAWTGAVNYLGYPMFFKENRIHRVSVSPAGAHSVSETVCRGVQPGSSGSLCVVNETLLYKSGPDICAYDGGFPVSVSEALGDGAYSSACAGAVGDRYYISMSDGGGAPQLFVYDLKRALWMHEDSLELTDFARLGNELYALSGNRLIALLGSDGEPEPYVEWMAESGILYWQQPDRKYVSRFSFRLQMEEGAELAIYIQYDSSGEWLYSGGIRFKGMNTVTVPVRPRRCDHLRIRLTGKGEIRLFSVARILAYGSDAG